MLELKYIHPKQQQDEEIVESLTSLETAKKALDKGLITQVDFDNIKEGFVAAQKIRAGIDAKLVREEDYSHNRDAFFELLGVKGALQKSYFNLIYFKLFKII